MIEINQSQGQVQLHPREIREPRSVRTSIAAAAIHARPTINSRNNNSNTAISKTTTTLTSEKDLILGNCKIRAIRSASVAARIAPLMGCPLMERGQGRAPARVQFLKWKLVILVLHPVIDLIQMMRRRLLVHGLIMIPS